MRLPNEDDTKFAVGFAVVAVALIIGIALGFVLGGC